jgi:serine/threonine protein phosphatase PrpC
VTAPTGPTWTLSASARTHIGLVRTVNEDRVLNRVDLGLFAIADGMGGHRRGDVAADAVIHALGCLANGSQPLTDDLLCAAMRGANRQVYGQDLHATGQSGSTVAGLHIMANQAFMFWVGDSRIYRWRAGRIELLTHDHRVVQEMIDAGMLDPQMARHHPRAAVITRAIGAEPTVSLAVKYDDPQAGDTYLLCSDGLTDLVETHALERLLGLPHAHAADALLDAAIAAGGRDNISLIAVSLDAQFRGDSCMESDEALKATVHHA